MVENSHIKINLKKKIVGPEPKVGSEKNSRYELIFITCTYIQKFEHPSLLVQFLFLLMNLKENMKKGITQKIFNLSLKIKKMSRGIHILPIMSKNEGDILNGVARISRTIIHTSKLR